MKWSKIPCNWILIQKMRKFLVHLKYVCAFWNIKLAHQYINITDVPLWLKSLRLHKYSQLFARMNYDEMLELTEEKLEQKVPFEHKVQKIDTFYVLVSFQGVTVGARRKIILSVQKLKERVALLQQLEKVICFCLLFMKHQRFWYWFSKNIFDLRI